jgi:dTDP-4-dehydrorhamnose 3,5-epimerase
MPSVFEKTSIDGLVVIKPRVFPDERGFFMETFKASEFALNGIDLPFVQDNHSLSSKGVVRGLHFQKGESAQGKLIRVIAGSVWDVAVDCRPESKTFLSWFGIELSAENKTMFYIPPGFAHGFVTLEDNTQFLYKCTAEFNKMSEGGIKWNDPRIGIDWPLKDVQVSEKDEVLPTSSQIDFNKMW